MFITYQEACDAITNNCNVTTSYSIKNTNTVIIGTQLYTDTNATVLAGTGFLVKDNNVYRVVNGIVTEITSCNVLTCSVSLTAVPSLCNSLTNNHSVSGVLTLVNPPISGKLILTLENVSQEFNAPFTSPINYTFNNIISDNTIKTVTASFDSVSCLNSVTYNSPSSCNSPVSSLLKVSNIYVGDENLYTISDIYLNVMGKFPPKENIITDIWTTNQLNIGSNVYKDQQGGVKYGTGLIAYQTGINTFYQVSLNNGTVVSSPTLVVSPIITNPSLTKILSPLVHQNGGQGYAEYDNNGNFIYWTSKLEIASDGLTISDVQWNLPSLEKYFYFNKEKITTPLMNFKIPEMYINQTVNIDIYTKDIGNIERIFHYVLKIGK